MRSPAGLGLPRAVVGALLLLLVAAAGATDTLAPARDDDGTVAAQQAIRVVDARGRASLEAALARGWRVERAIPTPGGTVYILAWG